MRTRAVSLVTRFHACPEAGGCGSTASVIRLMQTGLPASSSMRISHTCVLRPTCKGRAVPVTRPERTARRWLALISRPTTALPPAINAPALLPSVSASATEAPPCSRPYGWWVRASTGMVARRKPSPSSVNRIPIASINVPAERAFSASRVTPSGQAKPADANGGSAELEHARAPAARVRLAAARRAVTAGAAVAAGLAVAAAVIALAALVHAVDQFLATAVEPVGATQGGRVDAAAAGFVRAVIAEVVVGVELMLQLAHRQFDHHRVVEEAQHLDMVRDHVIRIAEVHQGGQHALLVFVRQCPALVANHRDHVVEAQQALLDEVRDAHLLRIGEQAHRAVDDLLLGLALCGLAGAFRRGLEMREVLVVELEVQGDRHGGFRRA